MSKAERERKRTATEFCGICNKYYKTHASYIAHLKKKHPFYKGILYD